MTEMPTKCPKCNYIQIHHSPKGTYACDSHFYRNGYFIQSRECRIRELEQQLATANARIATLEDACLPIEPASTWSQPRT